MTGLFQVRLAWAALRRPVIPHHWDRLLWSTGAIAIAAGVIVVAVPGKVADWVAFFAVVAIACGPTTVIIPFASEPFIMAFGRLHEPLVVALVGTGAMFAIEFVNYQLYADVLHTRALRRFRNSELTRRVVQGFRHQPFLIVFIVAFGPIPFDMVRAISAISAYSFPRFLTAMVAGRFPRLWLIALTGSVLPFTPAQILVFGLAIAFLVTLFAVRRQVRRGRHGIDMPRELWVTESPEPGS